MTLKALLICATAHERDALLAQLLPMVGVEIKVQVGNARSLAAVTHADPTDLVLMTLTESDRESFQQIEAATTNMPGTIVLLISQEPSLDLLKRAMRAGVRDVLPGPLSFATVQRAVEFVQKNHTLGADLGTAHGRLLAFMPVKGGSGCTFLVSNLGHAVAASDKRVLLIDLKPNLGDLASYVTERRPTTSILDVAQQSDRLDADLLDASVMKLSEKLHLLPSAGHSYWRDDEDAQGDKLQPTVLEKILALALSEYDFVFLDLGSELDPSTVKALAMAEQIFLILQLTLPAIQEMSYMTKVFRDMRHGEGKVQLIVNRYEKQGSIRLEDVERIVKTKVVRTIPSSYYAVVAAVNQAKPLVELFPDDVVSRAIQAWGNDVSPKVLKPAKRWLAGFFGSASS